jgi:rhodanese-related sulfurtransferase
VKLQIDTKTQSQGLLMALAAALVVAGCSDTTSDTMPALETIAQTAARQEDRVTPEQLADWIIRKQRDYRLLDIRSQQEFNLGHIEGAQNIPLTSLILPDNLAELPRERKLVVYSNGTEQAAKASVMLRVAGFDAYLLLGGYNHWQQRILNPDIPAEAADDETPEQALQRAISCYFAAPGERTVSELPTPVKPAKPSGFTPPLAPAGGAQPPRDEGC